MKGGLPAKAALVSAAFCLLCIGCASTDEFGGSRHRVVDWGNQRGFSVETLQADSFKLLALRKIHGRPHRLTVYLEGDGAAWITPYHPPRDPTPRQPTALALAALDPSDAVIYLGRPCQYLDEAHLAECSVSWWTRQRFAPEVLSAYEQALNVLKAESGAQKLRLIGYSGGGVIAALLALRRNDVDALITVASPLATGEWTRSKGLSPLSGSDDPLFEPGILPPAIFWTGNRDDIVPISSVELFARQKGGNIRRMSDYDHQCCWTRDWPRLLKESP